VIIILVSKRMFMGSGVTVGRRVGLWSMICYPLGKKRVRENLVKTDFAHFVSIFTVELKGVYDCFEDFLDDGRMVIVQDY
jgi:hypothetical protein